MGATGAANDQTGLPHKQLGIVAYNAFQRRPLDVLIQASRETSPGGALYGYQCELLLSQPLLLQV